MKKFLLCVGLSINLLVLAMGGGGSDDRKWCWDRDDSDDAPAVFYSDDDSTHSSALPLASTGVGASAAASLTDSPKIEDRGGDGQNLSDAELAIYAEAYAQSRLQTLQALTIQTTQGAVPDKYTLFLGDNFDRLVNAEDDQIVNELWPDARQRLGSLVEEMVDKNSGTLFLKIDKGISGEQLAYMQEHTSQVICNFKIMMQEQMMGYLGKECFRMQCIFLRKIWAARQAKQQAGAGGAAGAHSTT